MEQEFEDCQPPPDWVPPMVDDVTRMNATPVERICYPRCKHDVKRILAEAASLGRKVAMRGTKHSMGGQSIPGRAEVAEGQPIGGYVFDFGRLNHVRYDEQTELVTCGPGAKWSDLIVHLNEFGKAPRTMQSYSSFSVGGTLSVNGHGITTDHCMSESVVSFTLIKADGSEVVCERSSEGSLGDEASLWELVLGGYGMFGVVVELTMKTCDNVHMDLEYLTLDSTDDFCAIYGEVLKDERRDVVVKIARLNIIDLEKIDLLIYRRAYSGSRTVTRLPHEPVGMSAKMAILYKWVMPTMREQRYALERSLGSAVDISGESTERNKLLFCTAEPLANLYSPLLKVDGTFVLQEYFVPYANFKTWIRKAKPIYAELILDPLLVLLNTTIRFCRRDSDQAFLSYTRKWTLTPQAEPAHDGMFAFVLYYRLPRTEAADLRLKEFGNKFIDITLSVEGTFYLPYRLHYAMDSMQRAYPNVVDFFRRYKQKHDPSGHFDSLWFRQYGLPLCTKEYQDLYTRPSRFTDLFAWQTASAPYAPWRDSEATGRVPLVPERRSGFYRRLVCTHSTRKELLEGFLVNIFNLQDPAAVYRQIARAVWSTLAKYPDCPDIEVYKCLRAQKEQPGAIGNMGKSYKSLRQLSHQKRELAEETASLLAQIGKTGGDIGPLRDYVSIGDHGKMVLPLWKALNLKGKVWIVNAEGFSQDIPAVTERGCLDAVGITVVHDLYDDLGPMPLASEIADIVTINQGLHHLPQQKLHIFLEDVWRILRPGGVFIVREHDATPELMDMLDLAHSVYNAFRGVTPEDEAKECRAFRSVLEWRSIVEQFGFVDSMVYAMEVGDPTMDEMLCFVKPVGNFRPAGRGGDGGVQEQLHSPPSLVHEISQQPPVLKDLSIPDVYLMVLNQVPNLLLTFLNTLASNLDRTFFPLLEGKLKDLMSSPSMGFDPMAGPMLQETAMSFLNPMHQVVKNVIPFLEQAELQEFDSSHFPLQDLVPPEIFLVLPALKAKAARGKTNPEELMMLAAVREIENFVSSLGASGDEEGEVLSPIGRHPDTLEMFALLKKIVTQSPSLKDAAFILAKSGFTDRQQGVVRPAVNFACDLLGVVASTETMTPALLEKLRAASALLDDFSWRQIKAAFEEELSRGGTVPEPSKDALLGTGSRGENDVWNRAALAWLGSPYVRLNTQVTMGLRWIGLVAFIDLHERAQKLGRRLRVQDPKMRALDGCNAQIITAANGLTFDTRRTITMRDGELEDIPNVLEVISATFGYTSLTAKPDDVTKVLQQELLKDGVLRLKGYNFKVATKQGGVLDSARLAVVSTVVGKERMLTIDYWTSEEPNPTWYLHRANGLLDLLRSCHRLRARSAATLEHAAPFNWFKLPEWLQVEFMQRFGGSLEETPWFRFPYLDFMRMYSNVLYNEVMVVTKRQNVKAALAGEGFITSFVPGIMMGVFFSMLQALAMPAKLVLGESYSSKGVRLPEEEVVLWLARPEEIHEISRASSRRSFATPISLASNSCLGRGNVASDSEDDRGVPLWKEKIDSRIQARPAVVQVNPAQVEGADSLWVLSIPAFKPFTEILVKIALTLPSARVLEVSGHRELQVRVTVPAGESISELNALPGCKVMFDFQFPPISDREKSLNDSQRSKEASLCVSAPYLMSTVRSCKSMGITVYQIYDFYC